MDELRNLGGRRNLDWAEVVGLPGADQLLKRCQWGQRLPDAEPDQAAAGQDRQSDRQEGVCQDSPGKTFPLLPRLSNHDPDPAGKLRMGDQAVQYRNADRHVPVSRVLERGPPVTGIAEATGRSP